MPENKQITKQKLTKLLTHSLAYRTVCALKCMCTPHTNEKKKKRVFARLAQSGKKPSREIFSADTEVWLVGFPQI